MVRNLLSNRLIRLAILMSLPLLIQASPDSAFQKLEIIRAAKSQPNHPYFIDFNAYPYQDARLPIGMFDSGTGGLTVLQAVLKLDQFNNKSRLAGSDGVSDFNGEDFIYLGDDANMPYGSYESQGKTDFLKELIIKDVLFLLGHKYYESGRDTLPRTDKPPVKAIVIACNTATAYGYDLIRQALESWNLPIPVFGVIDGGAKSALSGWNAARNGEVIGVMATEGTCASMGYPRAIRRHYQQLTGDTTILVVQQPGIGLAGAIDQDRSYIDSQAAMVRGSNLYLGPTLDHPSFPIRMELWNAYRFDTTGHALLIQRDSSGHPVRIEINSVTNYIRYAVTHLVDQTLQRYPQGRLSRIILGCTHYPFFLDEFTAQLEYLRQLNPDYRRVIASDIELIDPAEATAMELYRYLGDNHRTASDSTGHHRFFISVANPLWPDVGLNDHGKFTFAYKYQRSSNQNRLDYKVVPITERTLDPAVVGRIRTSMPVLSELIFSPR